MNKCYKKYDSKFFNIITITGFEDDPLQMMEDVDLTAAMPMGDLGDRFEIKEHHLKKKEEVLKDDSFEDPAIVNSKKQQKPSGVQKTVESGDCLNIFKILLE